MTSKEQQCLPGTSKRWMIATLLGCALVPMSAQSEVTDTHYHSDALGSPVAATDSNGAVLWVERYAPFGRRSVGAASALDTSQWFTGHTEDTESGLIYMQARYYDPLIGRFMALDPKGVDPKVPQTFGRYLYAFNNPYGYIDPDGRDAKPAKKAKKAKKPERTGFIDKVRDGIQIGLKKIKDDLTDWPDLPDRNRPLTSAEKTESRERGRKFIEAVTPLGQTKVILRGGRKMTEYAARKLNEYAGTNYPRWKLGNALEKLRKELRNDDHGVLRQSGNWYRKNGEKWGNVFDALP